MLFVTVVDLSSLTSVSHALYICLLTELSGGGGMGQTIMNATLKLQTLVYDILPSRKVPESDARSVRYTVTTTTIKMDSNGSLFNVSFIVRGKVTRQCP